MTSYYDPQSRTRKSAVYTWTDISALTWADLDTWELADGNQYTLGTQTLVFLTEVIDHGKVEAVNPLCSVQANNTVNIKVYASDTFDSSSQVSGEPVIVGSQNTTLYGVEGRYFQFQIEVEDTATALAEISAVEFNLEPRTQQEFILGNSADHSGTQAERLAPLQKQYSKLLYVGGLAKQTLEDAPFITVGDITLSPAEAPYTVHKVERDVAVPDSSTNVGITDQAQRTSINTTYSGTPQTTARTYKWSPAAIQFNEVVPYEGLYYGRNISVTDTDDAIEFSTTEITEPSTTSDYTLEGWVKIAAELATNSDPEYKHPEYFVELYANSGEYIRLNTDTSSGDLRFSYNYNGTTGILVSHSATNPEGDWVYWRIRRASGTVYIQVKNSETQVGTSNTWGYNSGFVRAGDLGSYDPAALYMDDIRWSEASITGAPPTAPLEVTSDTLCLITGALESTTTELVTDVVTTDATVNLHIIGLPKMVSDASGNIIEGET